jgi:malate synthase
MNARYALNAANARWGSLYDALYGTNVIPEDDGAERAGAYNPVRGARVIAYARASSTSRCPLHAGQSCRAPLTGHGVDAGPAVTTAIRRHTTARRCAHRNNCGLPRHTRRTPSGPAAQPRPAHRNPDRSRRTRSGATDGAGMKDVVLESALTTIQDCEDSVAAVDAEDKVRLYATGWA